MMRVRFITNIPSPYRVDFFNQLSQKVHLTVIFEAETNDSLNENWYNKGSTYFKAVFLKKGTIKERYLNRRIFKEIKREAQDILIFTNYSYVTEIAGLIKAKILKIPYWLEVDGAAIKPEKKLNFLIKKFLIQGAERYFSSGETTDDFFCHYGVKRSQIIRYPFTSLNKKDVLKKLTTSNHKKSIRDKIGIHEEFVVLAVGQFIYRKGFDILLRAASLISSEIGIYFVGGEPTKEYFEMKKKLHLNNVHFIGFKMKEDLKLYYQAADVFVLPTREDVWGLVINEAMANGLPIITTDKCVAGLELVENGANGYIVPVDDVDQIAQRMKEILEDSEKMESMRQESLARIQNYTIENMAEVHIRALSI